MNLDSLAQEALTRMEGRPMPTAAPQLLACLGDRAILRTATGVSQLPVAELPAFVDLSPVIDHTALKAATTAAEIDRLCEEALAFRFASVCVNPMWVSRAAAALKGSGVRVCTVVGFPLGATSIASKAFEARQAVADGATEVDMVLAIGAARSGDWDFVAQDYKALREATQGVCLKVILETCLLTDEEKVKACELAAQAGLDFVKTSTGFSTSGATEADVRLMRETVGERCGVKASGGVRTYAEALEMVKAGATRLGLSCGVAVAKGEGVSGSGY